MRESLSTAVRRVSHIRKGGNMDYYTSFLLRHVDVTLECMANALRKMEKAASAIDKKWWMQEYMLWRTSLCKLLEVIDAEEVFR